MIYYIKYFKRIGRKFTHADVELDKICAMDHTRDMEGAHKDPEVVPTLYKKGLAQDFGKGVIVY